MEQSELLRYVTGALGLGSSGRKAPVLTPYLRGSRLAMAIAASGLESGEAVSPARRMVREVYAPPRGFR